MEKAANRELIPLEYSHDLEAKAFIGFSDQSGKEYIQISSEPISTAILEVWLSHPFNPWQTRFSRFTERLTDHGLIDEMKRRAMVLMKTEADVDFVPPVNRLENLAINDVLGIFLLLLICLVAACIAFSLELYCTHITLKL